MELILQEEEFLSNGVISRILGTMIMEFNFLLLGLTLQLYVQIGKMEQCSTIITMGYTKFIQQLIWTLICVIQPSMISVQAIKRSNNSCQTLMYKFGRIMNILTSANIDKDLLQKDNSIKIRFIQQYLITIHPQF